MISTAEAGAPAPWDINFDRHTAMIQEAFDVVIANTPPTDITHEVDGYDDAVAALKERVIYAEPWQRLSEVALRGSLGESVTANDMVVIPSWDTTDPLERRINEVSLEMSAVCQSFQPEDATKLKLLELDHILLVAQRPENYNQQELDAAVLGGLEQAERATIEGYQALMDQEQFEELFVAELDGAVLEDVSIEQVIAAEKAAFEALVAHTYEVEELSDLHDLAVQMQREIELRARIFAIARDINPSAAHAAEERIAEIIAAPAATLVHAA